MQILKNEGIPRTGWLSLLNDSPLATPFQTPDYCDLVNSVPGLSAEVYAVGENNEIAALCVVSIQKESGIKSYFSRRGVIYGGIVLRNNSSAALELLLKELNQSLGSKVIFAETRNSNTYEFCKNIFLDNGWIYQPELNYHLDCSSEETAWTNFNSSRKRQIRKALKNGAVIQEASSSGDIKDYYAILKNLYAEKIRKPLAPYAYFEILFSTGFAKFLLVKFRDKVIGGIVSAILQNKTIYELNVCGLDYEYKEQYPSVMATFAAIEYGYRTGLQRFDFMGAGSPEEEYGVREFKSKFGGKEVENGRFIKIFNSALYNVGKLAVNKLKWLVH